MRGRPAGHPSAVLSRVLLLLLLRCHSVTVRPLFGLSACVRSFVVRSPCVVHDAQCTMHVFGAPHDGGESRLADCTRPTAADRKTNKKRGGRKRRGWL